MKKTAEERFWAKVDIKRENECWLWTAFTNSTGYGQFWFLDKIRYAHRVSYTLTKGEIPEGMCVLHIECDNPSCVNPDHLELGTVADNMKDRDQKGRCRNQNMQKTHCLQGHSLSGDNLYVIPNSGKRRCCERHRIRGRAYYRRRKNNA